MIHNLEELLIFFLLIGELAVALDSASVQHDYGHWKHIPAEQLIFFLAKPNQVVHTHSGKIAIDVDAYTYSEESVMVVPVAYTCFAENGEHTAEVTQAWRQIVEMEHHHT